MRVSRVLIGHELLLVLLIRDLDATGSSLARLVSVSWLSRGGSAGGNDHSPSIIQALLTHSIEDA